ncbi:aminoglycoside phosphotransferase family protein [Paenibacillus kribbensis]|uniref:phosphotransferase family protein n=1 Tax=Paenibacillus kribbensis TaxID=172713 RepID=UPI002DBB9E59|nr:aminoglycoside phosphotransferase family protein [Paenibacillus kribbensis]MEC0233349.1 aminoglycoside phosphotransferase family protein [Paenibacillus kribbensis]
MTTTIYFSSNRLGEVTDNQLQRVLDRFDLGRLLSSEKTAEGVMGQTLYISSTAGQFVLKGNPLFSGQWVEERYMVEQLHRRTSIPVPAPYLVDDAEDIFGWSYAVMPRLYGEHIHTLKPQAKLTSLDKQQIAEKLAVALLELHSWKVKTSGELDTTTLAIRPFKISYRNWLYERIRYWLEDAQKYSDITAQDMEWVEDMLEGSRQAFDQQEAATFVMGDFKPQNVLVQDGENGWRISGLFDFTTAYFGDGVADLPKITTMYLENGEKELAQHFLAVYFEGMNAKEGFMERFRVHMLHQQILNWGCAKAMKQVTWDDKLSFAEWAQTFTDVDIFKS